MQGEELFFVKKPGLLTTFQDMGRTGYQRFGVPVSGAMDQLSMQVANILVGNKRDMACMEVTFIGPELEVCTKQPVLMAITGADLEPKINGDKMSMWHAFYIRKGDVLSFGKHHSGVRAYIAVSGGYDIPFIFDSQSTDIQSGFGKQLEKSTYIKGYLHNHARRTGSSTEQVGLHHDVIPVYKKDVTLSIIEGPHIHSFTDEGYRLFYEQIFTVDTASNRMGYRLSSDKEVTHNKDSEIWSDAVPFGAIQIPKNGLPIILMADRQTTGGYPRMGTVVSTDLEKIAQLPPHGTVKFRKVSIEEAEQKSRKREMFLHKLATFRQGF